MKYGQQVTRFCCSDSCQVFCSSMICTCLCCFGSTEVLSSPLSCLLPCKSPLRRWEQLLFGMLSWSQKPLWADSCHIFACLDKCRSAPQQLLLGRWCLSGGAQSCGEVSREHPLPMLHSLPGARGSADLELGQIPQSLGLV